MRQDWTWACKNWPTEGLKKQIELFRFSIKVENPSKSFLLSLQNGESLSQTSFEVAAEVVEVKCLLLWNLVTINLPILITINCFGSKFTHFLSKLNCSIINLSSWVRITCLSQNFEIYLLLVKNHKNGSLQFEFGDFSTSFVFFY